MASSIIYSLLWCLPTALLLELPLCHFVSVCTIVHTDIYISPTTGVAPCWSCRFKALLKWLCPTVQTHRYHCLKKKKKDSPALNITFPSR